MKTSLYASVIAIAILASSGCAGDPPNEPAPTVTVTATTTVTVTATPEAPASNPAPTTVPNPPTDPPGPSIITVAPGAARNLILKDAYGSKRDWREASYHAVGTSEARQAIGTSLRCGDSRELEFRFSPNQGTFKATVAHDMNSNSSSMPVEWALLVDGRKIETKQVAFNDHAELSTSLSGVTVVKLAPTATNKCNYSDTVTALVTKAVVQG